MIVPPGPQGTEVLGFFRNPLTFLHEMARRHGSFSHFRLLHQHLYLADDAEIIKEVLVTRQSLFARDLGALILRELVGDGLITREEPLHRERRRVLQPAFHREQIASYVETMSAETDAALKRWPVEEAINMGEEMRRITLAIIGSTLFGPEFRESAAGVSVVLRRVVKRAGLIAPFLNVCKPLTKYYRRVFPEGRSLFFASERGELDRILRPLIERRRGSTSRDVLSLLLMLQEGEDGKFSDEAIRNEIVTFVLAGHETTATALTWAFYLLAKHPEIQERLAAESSSVLGGRLPCIDDIPNLSFAANVFNETVRMYPPVPLFGRLVREPLTLGGYEIPQKATILLSPFITAHNESYFQKPYEFLPDRWRTDPPAPKFAYFPFGGGAKMCIGDTFAKTEGTLILSVIAGRFRLNATGAPEPGLSARATLQPLHPVLLSAQRR